jgi:hypothetical protein
VYRCRGRLTCQCTVRRFGGGDRPCISTCSPKASLHERCRPQNPNTGCVRHVKPTLFFFSCLFFSDWCDDVGSYFVMSVVTLCDMIEKSIMYRNRGPIQLGSGPGIWNSCPMSGLPAVYLSFFRGGHTLLHHSHSKCKKGRKRWWCVRGDLPGLRLYSYKADRSSACSTCTRRYTSAGQNGTCCRPIG